MENFKNKFPTKMPTMKMPDFDKFREQLKPVTLSNNISQLVNRYMPSTSFNTNPDNKDKENTKDEEIGAKTKKNTLKRQNATKRSHEQRPGPRAQNAPIVISTISGGLPPPEPVQSPKHKFLDNFTFHALKTDRLTVHKELILSIPRKFIKKEKTEKSKEVRTRKPKPSKTDIVHEHFQPQLGGVTFYDDHFSDSDFDDDELNACEEEFIRVEIEHNESMETEDLSSRPLEKPLPPPRRRKSLYSEDVILPSSQKKKAPCAPPISSAAALVENQKVVPQLPERSSSLQQPTVNPSVVEVFSIQKQITSSDVSFDETNVAIQVKSRSPVYEASSDLSSFEDFALNRAKPLDNEDSDELKTNKVIEQRDSFDIFRRDHKGDIFQEFDDIFHNEPPCQDSLPVHTIHKALKVQDLRFDSDDSIKTLEAINENQVKPLQSLKCEVVVATKSPLRAVKSSSLSSSNESETTHEVKRKVVERRPSTTIKVQDYRHNIDAIPRCKSILSPKHDDAPQTFKPTIKTKSEPNLPALESPQLVTSSVEQINKIPTSILKNSTSQIIEDENECKFSLIEKPLSTLNSEIKSHYFTNSVEDKMQRENRIGSLKTKTEHYLTKQDQDVKEPPKKEPILSRFATFSIESNVNVHKTTEISTTTPITIPLIYPTTLKKPPFISTSILPKPYRSSVVSSMSLAPKAKIPKAAASYLKQIEPANQTYGLPWSSPTMKTMTTSDDLNEKVSFLNIQNQIEINNNTNVQQMAKTQHIMTLSDQNAVTIIPPASTRKSFVYYDDHEDVVTSNLTTLNALHRHYQSNHTSSIGNLSNDGVFI